jgi:hypothetical protein
MQLLLRAARHEIHAALLMDCPDEATAEIGLDLSHEHRRGVNIRRVCLSSRWAAHADTHAPERIDDEEYRHGQVEHHGGQRQEDPTTVALTVLSGKAGRTNRSPVVSAGQISPILIAA